MRAPCGRERLPDFLTEALAEPSVEMGDQLSIIRLVVQASVPVQIVIGHAAARLAHLLGDHLPQAHACIGRARREADQFENSFWSGGDLAQLYRAIEARGGATGMASIFEFGFREFARLRQQGPAAADQLLEGARRAMRVAQLKEIDRLEHSLATLATVGSHQPLRRPVRHGVGHHERLLLAR